MRTTTVLLLLCIPGAAIWYALGILAYGLSVRWKFSRDDTAIATTYGILGPINFLGEWLERRAIRRCQRYSGT